MKKPFLLSILALAAAAAFSACDRDEPAITAPPPVKPAAVTINEIYARGDSLHPDWIEIYNPNATPVSVGGYRLYDDEGQTGARPKLEIPAGTTLPGLGFLVVTVDTAAAAGFGLSSGGESVWLEDAAGALVDSAAFPALGIDTSWARVPDGSSTWRKLTLPTRGEMNSSGGPVLPIVINEIFSRGVATDPDWVELYNPNHAPVTITGYALYDNGGNAGTKPKLLLPAGTLIPARGYLVVVTDITTEAWGFGLSSGGEEIWLENAAGAVIDDVTFPAMPVETQSYSRYPDGSATWQLGSITRGLPNTP